MLTKRADILDFFTFLKSRAMTMKSFNEFVKKKLISYNFLKLDLRGE